MIINYDPSGPELYLAAQNDQDRELLERIERECVTKGCGRAGDDLRIRHVRIELKPINSGTAAEE